MKTIVISGVIGWDISPKDIRTALDSAAGEEIEVQISSPGGIIFPGLEIFNLIKNYKGAKTVRLMGIAGSMASYVALSADRVIAEENAIFMIHNAFGGAVGDHRDMQKMAEILSGFTGMIAKAYAGKSGKPVKEIRSIMDEEGWYFGAEAKDAGFVDEIVPATKDPGTDKAAAMAQARATFAQCRKIVAEVENVESLVQAAACIQIQAEKTAGVAGAETAAKADGTLKTGGAMTLTLEELKRDHPALYAEATASERAAGVADERARVAALEKWIAADAGNARVAAIVAEAKATGKSADDVMPQLQVAVRDGASKTAAGENPPAVGTVASENGAGVDAETARMAAKMGVALDDIKKHSGEKGAK